MESTQVSCLLITPTDQLMVGGDLAQSMQRLQRLLDLGTDIMNYQFANNLFYPQALESDYKEAGSWPEYGVVVDEATFLKFTALPPDGKMLITDKDGSPAWGEMPAPTSEQLAAQAKNNKQMLIEQANTYINSKQWPGKAAIGRLKGDELAKYNLWLDYLDALDAINTSSAPDINWPVSPTQ